MPKTARSAASDEPDQRRPILQLAPKEFQCEWIITGGEGEERRCSRFTLKKDKAGEREEYCVSHSRSARAEAYRSKAASAQREAEDVRTEELADLAVQILDGDWHRRWDFNETRRRLFHHLLCGDVTVAKCNALAALVRDAERNAQTLDDRWRGDF